MMVATKSPMHTLLVSSGLAIVYYLAGKLGLLLQIPPGYASPLWPAAGLALVGLIRYGYRVWPGLFIGSFFLNVPFTPDYLIDLENTTALPAAFGIAVGTTLQAVTGYFLIQRFIKIESGLVKARDIMMFYLFVGPLSCLISVTWGVNTLWLLGIIDYNEFAYNWMTWWVGDSIGVMLIVPLFLIWFGSPQAVWQERKFRVAFPILISTVMVFLVFIAESRQEEKRIDSEFRERAITLEQTLEKELTANIEVLYALHSFFNTTEKINATRFSNFVQRALIRHQGIQALSWNPVIQHADRKRFEARMQTEGLQGFTITERDGSGELVKAAEREKYVAVAYISPLGGNEKAVGYDVYSDETRRTGLDLSRDIGHITGTAPITLVQESGNQRGVLFFIPEYHTVDVPETRDAKEAMLKGYVVGVYRTGDLLFEALDTIKVSNLIITLTDTTDANMPKTLARYRYDEKASGTLLPVDTDMKLNTVLEWQKTLQIGHRHWKFQVNATHGYLIQNRSWISWSVLSAGLLFSAMLGSFLMILTGRN